MAPLYIATVQSIMRLRLLFCHNERARGLRDFGNADALEGLIYVGAVAAVGIN